MRDVMHVLRLGKGTKCRPGLGRIEVVYSVQFQSQISDERSTEGISRE